MEIVNISDSPFHELPYRSYGAGGKERKLNLPFYVIEATGGQSILRPSLLPQIYKVEKRIGAAIDS